MPDAPRARRPGSLRLPGQDYRAPGPYFVTVCTAERRCLFGEVEADAVRRSPVGDAVARAWSELPHLHPGVQIDAWVLMPNHLHGILAMDGERWALGEVIRAFKARATLAARRSGLWGTGSGEGALWQRGFHDHVLRDLPDIEAHRQYIDDNPMKWALDRENPARTGAPPCP